MTEQQVWTSDEPTVERECWVRRNGVEQVVKMIRTDGEWDAVSPTMRWSWNYLSKYGTVRSAPIPPAEEIAAMRELETAARVFHPRHDGIGCGICVALSRLDATRAAKGATT